MPETPEYTVEYRNVKHPRIEYKTSTLLVILPKKGYNLEQVLEKYQKWIKRKQEIINLALQQITTTSLITTRTEKMLRHLVNRHVETAQKELNTKINKVYFKKMKTKWASHSKKSNLTINTLLKYLPDDLIEYIIYHETAHNIERKHNEAFWALINKKHPNHNDKENDLLAYWFKIQNNHHTNQSLYTKQFYITPSV